METKEIYLLTAFVCSACDGDIADEEITLLKDWCKNSSLFGGLNVSAKLNKYVIAINEHGSNFLADFLNLLSTKKLTREEQLKIVKIAIAMIEADGQILYSEVKFFKRLRACLEISDDEILKTMPDKEDYLLPDICTTEYSFDEDIQFSEIKWSNSDENF